MTVHQHRHLWPHLFDERAQQPHVVRVDHVGAHAPGQAPQVPQPGVAIDPPLRVGHVREHRAAVGHQVAHTRHRKGQLGRFEPERMDALGREPAHRRLILGRHTDNHVLLPARRRRVAHELLERDPAAGHRRPLREQVQDGTATRRRRGAPAHASLRRNRIAVSPHRRRRVADVVAYRAESASDSAGHARPRRLPHTAARRRRCAARRGPTVADLTPRVRCPRGVTRVRAAAAATMPARVGFR